MNIFLVILYAHIHRPYVIGYVWMYFMPLIIMLVAKRGSCTKCAVKRATKIIIVCRWRQTFFFFFRFRYQRVSWHAATTEIQKWKALCVALFDSDSAKERKKYEWITIENVCTKHSKQCCFWLQFGETMTYSMRYVPEVDSNRTYALTQFEHFHSEAPRNTRLSWRCR